MKTNWKKLINPDYLGAYSLDDGNGKYSDIVATIQYVKVENVTGPDGKKEDCAVIHFTERNLKPMILNVTNMKTLEKLFKSKYIEDWSGRKIQIGVESVKAFGDIVDALRIRKFLPRTEGPVKCAGCGGEIAAAGDMTAAQVAAYARKRFGAEICASCMKAAQDTAAPAQTETSDEKEAPSESDE